MKRLIIISTMTLALCSSAWAVPVTITDTTLTGATLDGTIGVGEYAGDNHGVNGGFGEVWGSGAFLHWDSDVAGNLQVGFSQGSGAFNDVAVIYIDSTAGGAASTVPLNDTGDPGRRAISGDGTAGEFSDLFFAGGFAADYAIAWDGAGNVNLFQLATGGGAHTFVTGLAGVSATHDERGFTLANIGLTPGDSFDYVVTYLNPGNAFRSNELMGDNYSGDNPGNNGFSPSGTGGDLTLATFSTFVSISDTPAVPEPSTALPLLLAGLALFLKRRLA